MMYIFCDDIRAGVLINSKRLTLLLVVTSYIKTSI